MNSQSKQTDEISRTLARIKADALAVVCAVIGGVGLFAMTAWLVIKDGQQAGQHLQLLSNYFVGYSVTWPGAFVGLVYGAMTGGAVGWAIGRIYNRVVNVRQR
ncbi:MAG: hypothetical protein KGS09_05875 [Nitrospirae bacterium]|nr:hypothetical protein [Nitrospirota bacterium]MBU6480055.1 hypothetical protein [Nitrospirota bacterium]MDE3040812.1 hypothetical protein [Nitrospirota bacterium]MDE3050277.1 hypothetical protein [Nitrospirota bacterium]MDE3220729.1 hypothetical protein [Nitrospirota bacterium]